MKIKSKDPFKNLVLDEYEQEISDAIEKGKYKSIPLAQREIKKLQRVARYTLKLRGIRLGKNG